MALLRDTAARQAKPKERKYYLGDGDNLRLMIHPNGSKYWCVRYRLGSNGTDKEVRIGKYPDVAIIEARAERNRIRDLVATGIDLRKDFAKKPVSSPVTLAMGDAPIFRAVGREWMRILPGKNGSEVSDKHRKSTQGRLDLHIYPSIGDLPVTEVTLHHMLDILKQIEDKGSTRNRVKGHMEAILFFALAHKYIDELPAKIPGSVLKEKPRVQHRKALPFEDLPKFLHDLDSWTSNPRPNGTSVHRPRGFHPITKFAFKFMILTLARPIEVRRAKWEQFHWEERL